MSREIRIEPTPVEIVDIDPGAPIVIESAGGVDFVEFQRQVLLSLQQFFGVDSDEFAGSTPLGDYDDPLEDIEWLKGLQTRLDEDD